jgi:hypothetical protein
VPTEGGIDGIVYPLPLPGTQLRFNPPSCETEIQRLLAVDYAMLCVHQHEPTAVRAEAHPWVYVTIHIQRVTEQVTITHCNELLPARIEDLGSLTPCTGGF